jgi:DNA mismatch repair protein MutL
MADASRIAVMSDELADQIAAGEVVERPAAVVKELVENAVDAGATRIDVELSGGGLESIRVVDDGRGIHPDDLVLALRRHATSKLHSASDLVEIGTHGFRGEALASIGAVARVRLRSRTPEAEVGCELRSVPGQAVDPQPTGMPVGTQVEVEHLFASVPARRKFMRSEATEVGHCSEAVLRLALVHPSVHFTLSHERRELINLPAESAGGRVRAILARRGEGEVAQFETEQSGIKVRAYFADPSAASRSRHGIFLVVRNRVVRERSLQQIVRQAYGATLPDGAHPVACLFVEPPPGTVDVNVHPQKTEVRFSSAQSVYGTVRELLAEQLPSAPWFRPVSSQTTLAGAAEGTPRGGPVRPQAQPATPSGYRLGTRAYAGDYATQKQELKRELEGLRQRLPSRDGASVPAPAEATEPVPAGPELLTCLPGPVAVFQDGDELLVVDLLELRAHLVYRRLSQDLGGEGVVAQGLLVPVVIKCEPDDIDLVEASSDKLRALGLDVERFGTDAVAVRAVPAQLRHCVADADVGDLFARVLPWLRLSKSSDARPDATVLAAIARTRGPDPAPRLARRWIRELSEDGTLHAAPGVRRLTVAELMGDGRGD